MREAERRTAASYHIGKKQGTSLHYQAKTVRSFSCMLGVSSLVEQRKSENYRGVLLSKVKKYSSNAKVRSGLPLEDYMWLPSFWHSHKRKKIHHGYKKCTVCVSVLLS